MSNYPSRTDIVTAMRNPQVSFKSNEIIGGSVIQKGSRIIQYSGGYTTVFPFNKPTGSKVAVRLWIADIGDAKKRSLEISNYLESLNNSYFAGFKYIDDAVLVNGTLHPIVIMDWVDGKTLKEYVNSNITDSLKILDLADKFKQMVQYFHQQNIAHGDLQHGNILVKKDGSMIGYGGSSALAVDDIRSDYLSSFADNPLRMENLKKKVSDGAGGLIEIDEQMPIFIEPTANGLTPMADALSFAKELIEGWLQKKPDNPAPIIINISDGLPYTGTSVDDAMNKAISVSKEIMAINSDDGNPLIFNSHIGDGGTQCGFEESESELSDDQAKFLFKISSKVPESYKQAAVKQDFKVKSESKGFVSNADPESFIKFINFGSSGGLDKIA